MKIIPIHYRKSDPVKKYFEIEDDAANIMQLIDSKDFKGIHHAAYAIAHAQVHENPFAFFVLDEQLVKGKGKDEERAVFESRVIINPQILEAPVYLREKGTLFRGHDEFDGELVAGKKPNSAQYMEGCMSFPHRKAKKLNRFNKIKVTYQVKRKSTMGLKRVTRWLEGLPSQVFQHEFDHCDGRNIFFDGLKD